MSILDGTVESVHISKASLCKTVLGERKGVYIIREVSWGVLAEGFHCIPIYVL